MNLRKLLVSSLLLSVGLMLHQITPPFLMGMKPDFLLSMMFIAILFSDDYKLTLVIGLAAGILTAMTTTFPGGQLPNIIDKILTCNFVFILIKAMGDRLQSGVKIIIVSILGTLFSGFAFLLSALYLAGLPAPFLALVLTVVVPASILNTVFTTVLFNAVAMAMKKAAAK
ncbi:MAG: tryptophan transporter [Bacillota bacterium]|nr:tryptophan transporter [Bacillota bacterium]